VPPSELDPLAESLARTLPACDDAPLALAVLHELANGEPVVASTFGERAEAVLAGWPNVNYDEDGRVIAFSGLSLTPTAHRFTVGGRQLYTWCAWDTLFLPAMLGRPADVESTCPVTGSHVRLTVDPNGIRQLDPQPLWVSFPPAATTSTADIPKAQSSTSTKPSNSAARPPAPARAESPYCDANQPFHRLAVLRHERVVVQPPHS